MFGIFRRLSALEARVEKLSTDQLDTLRLVEQLDPAELTRLRQTVLNAVRGLARHQKAEEDREATQRPGPAGKHPWVSGGR